MNRAFSSFPVIDIAPLLGPASAERDRADKMVMGAAATTGFFAAGGFGPDVPIGARARAELLRIFQLPPMEIRKLWRRKFDPARPNVYRGWFPVQPGFATAKEGIDLGADVVYGTTVVCDTDPLREATPLPPEEILPGWRDAVAVYYKAMQMVSAALMRCIARGLSLPERYFDAAFDRGLSTLRLIRYPVRPVHPDTEGAAGADPDLWVEHGGVRRCLTGAPHVDSGFLTLLAQHGVAGLQARRLDGEWMDVPPTEGTLVVNFGKVLERWCASRIRATEHRVVGIGHERRSIPFFYEARADARIASLPGDPQFAPFFYGDHLWATTTQFVEFKGLESLRRPFERSAR